MPAASATPWRRARRSWRSAVDLRCDGVIAHRAEIATAHVVTLVRVPDRVAELDDDKVRPLFSAF